MASIEPTVDDGYVLGRTQIATLRLNYQHYLWQQASGFHLHPSIPPLAADAHVADLATSSGIWLLELAEQLPHTACLDGLDVSLEQCPPKAWLPANVTFRTWNFFTEVPEDLVARYDVIHIRLVACAIKNNDSTVMVKNVAQLLKPGGYLQWDELDTLTAHVTSPAPDVETKGLEQLRQWMTSPMRGHNGEVLLGSRDWIEALPATLTANGFCDAQKYQYCEPKYMSGFWTDAWVPVIAEFSEGVLKAEDEEEKKRLKFMELRSSSERAAGAALRWGKMSVVVQREK